MSIKYNYLYFKYLYKFVVKIIVKKSFFRNKNYLNYVYFVVVSVYICVYKCMLYFGYKFIIIT